MLICYMLKIVILLYTYMTFLYLFAFNCISGILDLPVFLFCLPISNLGDQKNIHLLDAGLSHSS